MHGFWANSPRLTSKKASAHPGKRQIFEVFWVDLRQTIRLFCELFWVD
jgi:hypothetical protein